jgi:serine protease Do
MFSWTRNRLPAVVALLCLATASPVHAQWINKDGPNQRSSPAVKAAFKSVIAGPNKSTVRVQADGKDAAYGTIVAADGWILTKFDQIRDAENIVCRFKDGRKLEARVVGAHVDHDLAILKVDAKDLTPIEWRDSKTAPVGHWLVSAGPGEDPVSIGVVSVATRTMHLRDYPPAPLPADGGFLGVGLEPGRDGAKINNVMDKSAAAEAGIQVDDVVLQVAGKRVEDPDTMINILRAYKVNDTVTLRIRRGASELDVSAKLKKRPPGAGMNRAIFQNSMGKEISRKNSGFPVVLQHDSVLKRNECGGPVVDLDGKAIGVNIASAGRVDSYAVPSEVIRSLLPDLMSGKLPPPEREKTEAKDDLD